jgi:hypothetical protein
VDGHFSHQRETGNGCDAGRVTFSLVEQRDCRAFVLNARRTTDGHTIDFVSAGLILNEIKCGGAAMAERSNWTTP